MSSYDPSRLLQVSRQFHIHGELLHAEPCKVGHINETYTATYDQGGVQVRYIHQRINHEVFRDPIGLMENLHRVTTHVRKKLAEHDAREITRRTLTLVPAKDGESYHRTSAGEYWRTYVFIEKVRTFEAVESAAQAYEAGKAFGEFQSFLVDLPGPTRRSTNRSPPRSATNRTSSPSPSSPSVCPCDCCARRARMRWRCSLASRAFSIKTSWAASTRRRAPTPARCGNAGGRVARNSSGWRCPVRFGK